ncbi:diguanylate cyclase [Vreelandella subglaciescola]|uniref:Diguanylate cyclase n=1 Tax=Vreelandella subglaciescola TaxID=29571 RepID=A0A1M7E8X2_9GAMM|nr:GGDEF domain-containing protein [Halomonas subglaciescola]SHL88110.1 diguanylate cyclase [Halomonas subglaciescola]
MNEHQFSHRLMTLVYIAAPLLMAGYAAWRYATGDYVTLFTPLFLVLVLLAALLLHLFRSPSVYLPRMILLVATYVTMLAAIWQPPEISLVWLGLPLAATFLLLPLWSALTINVLLAPIWWFTPLHSAPPSWVVGFFATALLLALPRWEQARRQALLRATDSHDSECSAYHIDALHERLQSEYQRAAVLNRHLAVLVIHLPQLDMAGEQFGHRAQLALLDALCQEVSHQCRDYDVLGRATSTTFWLVLPTTSESGALLVRERLTRALSRRVLVETGQIEVRIAVSLPRHREDINPFIQRLEARAEALAAPLEAA